MDIENTQQTITIDILDLNRQNFDYGYFSFFDNCQRYIRLYTAFRALFVIDQLHDFLEFEDRNKLFKKRDKDDKTSNTQRQIDIYTNIVTNFIDGMKDCVKHFNERFNCNSNSIQQIIQTDNIKINSVFFGTDDLNFFQLIFKYFSISEKTFAVDIPENKLPIILKGQNKYIILDEILLRIFSIQHVNLDNLFESNNTPYNCSENIQYVKKITNINYNNRYYPDQTKIDDESIIISVDADKSKYGISELTRQACSLNGKTINFIKTIATKFDSASTSTTESLLRLIDNRNKKQQFRIGDNINMLDLTTVNDRSVRYIIELDGYRLIDFIYTLMHPTDIDIPFEFINYVDKPYSIENFKEIHIKLNINKKLDYIDKIFERVKKFVKEYTFPDETKIYNEDGSLLINKFLEQPPYNVVGFGPKVKKSSFSPLELHTLFTGLNAIYVTIKDKITLEEFCEQIFPGYMKIVKLDIEKFFEVYKPTQYTNKDYLDFNQTNSSVASITSNIMLNFNDDELKVSKIIPYIFAHKTLGDFGQIVSFYATNNIIFKPKQMEFGSIDTKPKGTIVKTRSVRDKILKTKEQKKQDKDNLKLKMAKLQIIKCVPDFNIEDKQMIEFKYNNAISKNVIIPTETLKFFITFDRICSRISSIFNHGTIYESTGMTLSPLETFTNYCMPIDADIIPQAELLLALKR